MSIALVQTSTPAAFSGTSSAATTLNGVTSGNTIIVIVAHVDTNGGAPTFTTVDSQSQTVNQDAFAKNTAQGASGALICSLYSANSGTHTITATASTDGAESQGYVVAMEFSGIAASGFDKKSTNTGQSQTPTTGNTSALTVGNELVVCALAYFNGGAGGTYPPTGGTGTYTSVVNHTSGSQTYDGDYQIDTTNSTSAVSAAWGTITASGKWAACVATYEPATTSTYSISCAYGSFSETGIAAGLAIGSNTAYVMLCNPGAFDLIGAQSISQLSIYPQYGSFVLTGLAAIFSGKPTYIMLANTGFFAETGGNANLTWFVSGSMPNFVGSDYYTATALAALLGLAPQTPVEVNSKSAPPGTVIAQSLAPNTVIIEGMPITFSVVKESLLATSYSEPPM